jgi:hypothetical protein
LQPVTTQNDGVARGRSHDAWTKAGALANAARELLRARLGEDARPLVERLADLIEEERGTVGEVVDFGSERAKRQR